MLYMTGARAAGGEAIADVNRDQQVITIYGDLGTVNANKRVTLTVLKKGYTFDDLSALTPNTVMNYYNHIAETYTDNDGKYSTNYSITSPSGRYLFRVSNPVQKGTFYEGFFDYYGPDSVRPVLEEIALVKDDIQQMKSKLTNPINSMILGLNFELYGHYSFENLDDDIYRLISKYPDAFASAAQLKEAYLQAVATHLINVAADGIEIDRILIECDKSFKILDKKPYEVYQGLDTSGKTVVVNALISGVFTSAQDVVNCLTENSLLQAIYRIDGYMSLKKLIEDNNVDFKINLQAYKNLNSTTYVDKTFSGKLFSSLSVFRTEFDNMVVNNPYEPVVSQPKTPSGDKSSPGKSIAPIVSQSGYNTNSTPIAENSVKSIFKDLDEVQWSREAIEKLHELKIVNGKSEDRFAPNDNITREEFIKMLVLMFDLKNKGDVNLFEDIDSNQWYAEFIKIARGNEICSGISDQLFGIGMPITRQDMMTMAYRALEVSGTKLKDIVDEKDFVDETQISDYAKEAIKSIQKANIISGYEDGRFAPANYSTRAEAAKLLYGLLLQKGEIQ